MNITRPAHLILIDVNQSDTDRFLRMLKNLLSRGWRRAKASKPRFISASTQVPVACFKCTRDLHFLRSASTIVLYRASPQCLAVDEVTDNKTGRELSAIARAFTLLDFKDALERTGFPYAIAEAMNEDNALKIYTNKCLTDS